MASVMNWLFAARSPTFLVLLAFITLAVVGASDYLTGFQISFAVFYLVPVGMTAWYVGRAPACVLALASSIVWYTAETAGGYPYDSPLIPVWNAFVRFSFFLIVAMLLSALRHRLQMEEQLAKTDALTGVANSRAFADQLTHDLALMQRTGDSLGIAYIDLDDFKRINDTRGHREGDRLLQRVGAALVGSTRRSDTVARLGGDEFALILPTIDLAGAEDVVAKVRRNLREALVLEGDACGCSIGVVIFDELPTSIDDAIASADNLMYEAKARGKGGAVFSIYAPESAAALRFVSPPQKRTVPLAG